jgi:alpha-L-arabinofuranosidase
MSPDHPRGEAPVLNRIKIDLDRTVGEVDRNLFGGFVEHLGRCVYGGIYDPGSAKADEHGLRSDVRAAIEGLGLSNIRYPGGNFASGYRWRDGVGPVDERPARPDLAWGAIEPNTFGTNEFIRFCRTVGVEPYLVVNCGDGDLREARDWVEYCNGRSDTAMARLRAAHGFPEPHRVRYWGIGNEVDGAWQIGAKSPAEYARAYHEFAKAMRRTDPDIRLIASATSDWDGDIVERVTLLTEEAADLIDYLSIHWYVGDAAGDADAYLATSETIEARLTAYEGLARGLTLGGSGRRTPGRPIPLAVDEWNVWYRTTGDRVGTPPHLLEETYDLADALVVAMHLNAFIRHASTVRMANLAQLVNAIAPIVTGPDGLVLQTIYHPFALFSRTAGRVALDAWWDGDTFSGGDHKGVRTIDVSSSIDPDARRLAVHVVNRHQTDALEGVIELVGGRLGSCVAVTTIDGPDLRATNVPGRPESVTGTEEQLEIRPSREFHHAFPPRSVTGLVFTDLT